MVDVVFVKSINTAYTHTILPDNSLRDEQFRIMTDTHAIVFVTFLIHLLVLAALSSVQMIIEWSSF